MLYVKLKNNMKKTSLFFAAAISVCIGFNPFEAAFSQNIVINTTGSAANSSALLEVGEAANLTAGGDTKGLLCPHVALTNITDVATITTPANGLIVYNTNAAMTNGNGVGLYYYCSSGCTTTGWKFMAAADNGPGTNGQVLTSQGAAAQLKWQTPTTSSTGTNPLTTVTNEFTAVNGSPCIGAACTGALMTLRDCINTCDNYNDGTYSDYEVPLTEDLLRAIDIAPNNTNAGSWVWTVSPVATNFYSIVQLWDAGRINSTATNTLWCRCVR